MSSSSILDLSASELNLFCKNYQALGFRGYDCSLASYAQLQLKLTIENGGESYPGFFKVSLQT